MLRTRTFPGFSRKWLFIKEFDISYTTITVPRPPPCYRRSATFRNTNKVANPQEEEDRRPMATVNLMYGRKHQSGVNWITVIAMSAFHVGAVAALFNIDYGAMAVAFVLYVISGSWGIGMAYHRLLTHRSYKTHRWIEYFLTICGTLALEGGPIFWVATHRIHHQRSDREGDPHTPREGTYWAHMGWIITGKAMHHNTDVLARYTPDLSKDKFHVAMTTWHWIP